MKLSLFYFTSYLFILLSTAEPAEFNIDSCPTSRRLLFLGGFNFPLGEKKSEHVSSSSKSSAPPKYAQKDNAHGLTVFIRPQTSSELGHKVRSYTHLLKSKLFTKAERAKLKKLKTEKKKAEKSKPIKKHTTTTATQHATKTRDLVAVNDDERDRCRALLHIGHQNSLVPVKKEKPKKLKKEKTSIISKAKNITTKAKKKIADKAAKSLPIKDKQKPKKEKTNTKSTSNEKKKSSENKPLTPPPSPPTTKEVPVKKHTTTTTTATTTTPTPPPPSSNTKSKREKPPPVIIKPTETSDMNEPDEIDNDEKNNSVVGRAYFFVKNMFQLSDDILEANHTHEEDEILSSTPEQHRSSRKLLSINNDDEFKRHLNEINNQQLFSSSNDLSLSAVSLSKRHLLAVKTNKRSTSSKDKKTNLDKNKPKVGWAYRYRISRYLADQKMKRTGHAGKKLGGGKSKANIKKISSSTNTKISKRKLLELDINQELNSNIHDISNQDIVNTVSITQQFVPKRQLLSTKKVVKHEEETDDESNIEKMNERRRLKSYEELTDPVEIVRSYDRGLFKPRVGWQFRYRVSRYIDSLRDNIREDQERLKLGLQAIKRKTPQELSGRRKRVLDKPFTPEPEQTPTVVDENKPNVGWRYRYRISKMLEAKRRGEYIDDDELKRQARDEQKRKQHGGAAKPAADDEECLEWEYDLDPELRKISEEGKRVGWAYRYRIRRKLDELKQKQAETGIPFDLETLGGKREKKPVTTTTSSTVVPSEKHEDVNKKAVGWQYRYRVSKMREAQKHEAAQPKKETSKKQDQLPSHERLDPALARLTPEERVVGWQYRYRIRRKLDAMKDATRDTEGGKRGKKQKQTDSRLSKQKDKEKIIKKVEESIEKILNIDDIDETPFMEYVRRTSSYIFHGLAPTARKSICLLPLPVKLSFCKEIPDDDKHVTKPVTRKTEILKESPPKKLRTKKEKRAKQFIPSRSTKLDATDEKKVHEPVKPVSKTPTPAIEKHQKKHSTQRSRPPIRRTNEEQTKHYDEEEHPIKKLVGVESKKKKNKKRFQIIGQEVKIKHKHATDPPAANSPPVSTTTHSTPVTITNPPPVTTTTPAPPPSRPPPPTPGPQIVSTTTQAPLRTISEIIQEEAATLLTTKSTSIEETKEEINEANEKLETTTTTTTATTTPKASSTNVNDDASSSDEEDNDSNTSDSESSSSDSDNDSNEKTEEKHETSDPLAMKKMKQLYEKTKESVHDVFDLKDDQNSS